MKRTPFLILFALVFLLYAVYLKAQDPKPAAEAQLESQPKIPAKEAPPPPTAEGAPSAETSPKVETPPPGPTAEVPAPTENPATEASSPADAVSTVKSPPPSQRAEKPSQVGNQSPKPPIEIPQMQPGTGVFIYDPTGRRDPFDSEPPKPPEEAAADLLEAPPPPKRAIEPLEHFDIGQLKLNAIIWDTKNPRAMIQDPNGEIHFVKLRTRIGQKNGFIVAIREGEVVIVEYNQQGDKWVKSFNTLELR